MSKSHLETFIIALLCFVESNYHELTSGHVALQPAEAVRNNCGVSKTERWQPQIIATQSETVSHDEMHTRCIWSVIFMITVFKLVACLSGGDET